MGSWKMPGTSQDILESVWNFANVVGNCLELHMDCLKMSVNSQGLLENIGITYGL